MEITRGTTPTITVRIPSSVPLNEASEIWFTIAQSGDLVVDRKLSDNTLNIEGQTLTCKLTQEETLRLHAYEEGECGIRAYFQDREMALATSQTEPVIVHDVVKNGIIGGE